MDEDAKLIRKIVRSYDIGRLQSFSRLERQPILLPAFVIKTTKGKYFTKQCRHFNYYTRKGLWLLKYLEEKGYPAVRILRGRKKRYYVMHNGKAYALYRFLILPGRKKSVSESEAYSYGSALGRLHVLTHGIKIKCYADFYKHMSRVFLSYYYLFRKAPPKAKRILAYYKENLPGMIAPQWLPKAYLHSEFSTEHVFFKKGKVWEVIDFEDFYRDHMFYDLGVPMLSMIERGLDYGKLRAYIRGYESERKLLAWEKEHLFEAALFGAFRFITWSMEHSETWGWNGSSFGVADKLIRIGKKEFMKKFRAL